mmetsp:Transcript_44170/g.112735  ORF Transcript_44170/g.112735 Transcript_44170/m.112735 type:complete len:319 (-) Transcript_44170:605-1561(-)
MVMVVGSQRQRLHLDDGRRLDSRDEPARVRLEVVSDILCRAVGAFLQGEGRERVPGHVPGQALRLLRFDVAHDGAAHGDVKRSGLVPHRRGSFAARHLDCGLGDEVRSANWVPGAGHIAHGAPHTAAASHAVLRTLTAPWLALRPRRALLPAAEAVGGVVVVPRGRRGRRRAGRWRWGSVPLLQQLQAGSEALRCGAAPLTRLDLLPGLLHEETSRVFILLLRRSILDVPALVAALVDSVAALVNNVATIACPAPAAIIIVVIVIVIIGQQATTAAALVDVFASRLARHLVRLLHLMEEIEVAVVADGARRRLQLTSC